MAAPTNLHRDLGRMEGKLDAVLSEMRGSLRLAHERLDDHGSRIEVLEDRETRRGGAWGVIKSVWAAIAVFLVAAATAVTTWVLKVWGVS